MKLLIRGGRVLDPASGTDGIRDILTENGVIREVGENLDAEADTCVDASGKWVLPGLIDLHVHFRDPGFTDKETIRTGARAAARGGFTTVCQMPNTRPVVDSAEAAAEGAGIDLFEPAEGVEISLGKVEVEQYRCMDGIAEARIPIAAVDMTIRKGKMSAATDGDISGDYGEYAHEWTQNIKGLEVKCFGNREGESTRTIWTVDDYAYSIVAYGAGGDTDYGLKADDLNSLINAIQ